MKSDRCLIALVAIVAMGLSGSVCPAATTVTVPVTGTVAAYATGVPSTNVVDLVPTIVNGETTGLNGSLRVDIYGNTSVNVGSSLFITLRNSIGDPIVCSATMSRTTGSSGAGDWHGDYANHSRPADEDGYQVLWLHDAALPAPHTTHWQIDMLFIVSASLWSLDTGGGTYTHTMTVTLSPGLGSLSPP